MQRPKATVLLIALAMLLPLVPAARAATRTVTNLNDTGAGSLRATIAVAAAGDNIVFASSISGGTITLTTTELVIAKNLTITGPGANLLKVARRSASGTPNFRIFNVTGGTVAIAGLTISNGRVVGAVDGAGYGGPGEGGGIRNQGALTLTNCALNNNYATGGIGSLTAGPGDGGGISNHMTLTLTGCTLNANLAEGGSGTTNGSQRSGDAHGGGLSNHGTLALTNCTLYLSLTEGVLEASDQVLVWWHDLRDAQGQVLTGQTGPLRVE